MHPRTLTALQKSIEHWHRLATGTYRPNESIYDKDCALCSMFYKSWDHLCTGCPVASRTGRPKCFDTPWRKASGAEYLYTKDSPAFQNAAAEELAFLKSLLPEYCNPPQPAQLNLPPLF